MKTNTYQSSKIKQIQNIGEQNIDLFEIGTSNANVVVKLDFGICNI
jgi:hypothetical protein